MVLSAFSSEATTSQSAVDFLTMTFKSRPVRRLSTASSVSKPPHFILTTEWLWYWRNDTGQWLEFGQVRLAPQNVDRAATVVTLLKVAVAFLPCRKTRTRRPPSPPPCWRNSTGQTETGRFRSVLEISSISSTLQAKKPRCISRTWSTKPRERSDGGLVSCQLTRWR